MAPNAMQRCRPFNTAVETGGAAGLYAMDEPAVQMLWAPAVRGRGVGARIYHDLDAGRFLAGAEIGRQRMASAPRRFVTISPHTRIA